MPTMGGDCVYMSGLDICVNQLDIEQFFQGYGPIRDIFQREGCAFITFEDPRDADNAVCNLNGAILCGTSVTLSWAKHSANSSCEEDKDEIQEEINVWDNDVEDDLEINRKRRRSSSNSNNPGFLDQFDSCEPRSKKVMRLAPPILLSSSSFKEGKEEISLSNTSSYNTRTTSTSDSESCSYTSFEQNTTTNELGENISTLSTDKLRLLCPETLREICTGVPCRDTFAKELARHRVLVWLDNIDIDSFIQTPERSYYFLL